MEFRPGDYSDIGKSIRGFSDQLIGKMGQIIDSVARSCSRKGVTQKEANKVTLEAKSEVAKVVEKHDAVVVSTIAQQAMPLAPTPAKPTATMPPIVPLPESQVPQATVVKKVAEQVMETPADEQKTTVEEGHRQVEEAKMKEAKAERTAELEAAKKAKVEAEASAKRQAEIKEKAEEEVRAKAEAEKKEKAAEQARIQREAEEKAEAAKKAQVEVEAMAKKEAEKKAEVAKKAQVEAEAMAKKEAEKREKAETEAKIKPQAEEPAAKPQQPVKPPPPSGVPTKTAEKPKPPSMPPPQVAVQPPVKKPPSQTGIQAKPQVKPQPTSIPPPSGRPSSKTDVAEKKPNKPAVQPSKTKWTPQVAPKQAKAEKPSLAQLKAMYKNAVPGYVDRAWAVKKRNEQGVPTKELAYALMYLFNNPEKGTEISDAELSPALTALYDLEHPTKK